MKLKNQQSSIDPELVAPHYSVRVFRGFLLYIEQKMGPQRAMEFVGRLGIPWEFFQSESNWVSDVYSDRLIHAMSQQPEFERDFSYEAGRLATSKELGGVLYFLVTQFFDPSEILKRLPLFVRHSNKIDAIEVLSVTGSRAVISFRVPRKTGRFDLQLDNWKGYLEHIPVLFGLPKGSCKVRVTGDYEGLFDITWEPKSRRLTIDGLWRRHRLIFLTIAYAVVILFIVMQSMLHGILAILGSLFLVLLVACFQQMKERKRNAIKGAIGSLESLLLEMEDRYGELHRNKYQLDRRIKENALLSDLAQTMNAPGDAAIGLNKALENIRGIFGWQDIIFLKLSETHDRLVRESTASSLNASAQVIHLGFPLSSWDPSTMELISRRVSAEYSAYPEEALVVYPITLGGRLSGVLLTILGPDSRALEKEEKQFLEVVAGQIAVLIENRGLRVAALDQKRTDGAGRLGEVVTQVAHDIRSPLAALNVAIAETQGLGDDYRQVIRNAVQRIRGIADDLLSQARKDSSNLGFNAESNSGESREELFSVGSLRTCVEEVVKEARVRYGSKDQLGLEVSNIENFSESFCNFQPGEFRRVLSNLIDNAVEASAERGEVKISFQVREDQVVLSVVDIGKGIPPEVLSKLGRKGETHGKKGGTGLGLYYSMHKVKSWGGTLRVESKLGEGSLVTIALPLIKST